MRKIVCLVAGLSLTYSPSVLAQVSPDPRTQPLRSAIVLEASAQAAAASQPFAGWRVVRSIDRGAAISVLTSKGPGRWRFVAATDDELIVTGSGVSGEQHFDRDDVERVSVLRTAHHQTAGLVAGGVALGLLAGFTSAAGLAFKQCGGSCADEQVLIGLSLFGLPVAGGALGWQLSTTRSWALVYERGV